VAFALRLRSLRLAAGLTQKQLADKAGVGQRTISHLEQGVQEPVWPTALALAQALGVNCRAFVQRKGGEKEAVVSVGLGTGRNANLAGWYLS
jgi:transcriptional regulator with XRE-family HTH domain